MAWLRSSQHFRSSLQLVPLSLYHRMSSSFLSFPLCVVFFFSSSPPFAISYACGVRCLGLSLCWSVQNDNCLCVWRTLWWVRLDHTPSSALSYWCGWWEQEGGGDRGEWVIRQGVVASRTLCHKRHHLHTLLLVILPSFTEEYTVHTLNPYTSLRWLYKQ